MIESAAAFYKNQTLAMAWGGHMGGFFINFMMADHPRYDEYARKKFYGCVENTFEWLTIDYFSPLLNVSIGNYVCLGLDAPRFNLPAGVKEQLKQLGLSMEEALFLRAKLFACKRPANELTYDSVLELLHKPVDAFDFDFVRSHPEMTIGERGEYQYLNPKRDLIEQALKDTANSWLGPRVFCYFPVNKQWISSLLECYKASYWPTVKFNRLVLDDRFDRTRLTPEGLIKIFDPNYLNFPKVDMYKLVFEKDITDIVNIFPNFVFSEKKKQLLQKAHESQLIIMNTLGLDHTNEYFLGTDLYYDLADNDFFSKYMAIVDQARRAGTL